MQSSIPSDVRHVVHVLSIIAKRETGIGWAGQETIAKATGLSVRHIRRAMAALAASTVWPVRLERRARFRPEGRGRTSDEWRLVLADQPDQGAGYSHDQPAQQSGKSRRLTGPGCTTNRTKRSDQPDHQSGDPGREPRSEPRSSSASTSEAVPFRLSSPSKKARKKPSATRAGTSKAKHPDPEHGIKHAKVVAFYFQVFEGKRGTKPVGFDGADGKAVTKLLDKCKGDADEACKVIAGAFASWKGNTVTIRDIANNPSAFAGTQQRSGGSRTPIQPSYGVNVNAEIVED